MKSFWKCETSETFSRKGFWPPGAKVAVDLGLGETTIPDRFVFTILFP
jgi:hypothetical protein